MKRFVSLLSALCIISLASSQVIDSLNVFEINSRYHVMVYGLQTSSGEHMSRVEYSVSEDTIEVELFYLHCSGFHYVTPFDTLIDIGNVVASDYTVICRTISDINLDSSICFANYSLKTIDSLTFYYQHTTPTSCQFAPVGAEWHYSEGRFGGFPIAEDYIKLTSVKDTFINGVVCRQLTKRHQLECNNRPAAEYVYNNHDTVFYFDPSFKRISDLVSAQCRCRSVVDYKNEK